MKPIFPVSGISCLFDFLIELIISDTNIPVSMIYRKIHGPVAQLVPLVTIGPSCRQWCPIFIY